MTNFKIHELARRGQDLIALVTDQLTSAPSEKIRSLAGRLPTNVAAEEGPVRVVLAGQYSAGKSTILNALTGREEIAIGADITTKKSHEYDWNGISVIDTPGVYTEVRPDHDRLTYRAISEADLLVFVVTNELFDAHIAKHFRKLAVERGKAHEMMLAVNKMQRCAGGNTAAAQSVIREDLRRVLDPFTPEELRTSFIDAETVLVAQREPNGEMRRILERKSGFGRFVDALNEFVRDKGLIGRYTSALYSVEQVLQEAVASESTGDKDTDAIEELLLRKRRALAETKVQLPRAVEGRVRRTSADIRQGGRDAGDLIHGDFDAEDVNRKIEGLQQQADRKVRELESMLQQTVAQIMAELNARLEGVASGELAKALLPRLEGRLNCEIPAVNVASESQGAGGAFSDVTRQLGEFITKHSLNPNAGAGAAGLGQLFKLKPYSGSGTHGLVKVVGHLFGKSFRPWEAVKWTRGIATAGRGLSVAGVVLSAVSQIAVDKAAEEREHDLRKARTTVRTVFGDAANAVDMHFDKATDTYVAENIDPPLTEVDEQLDELRSMKRSRGDMFRDLEHLLKETQELIRDAHGE
ncbi:MAG: GTPase domain-containing protein [Spirochaetaceae bacterium]|nr:GTPase domain-containing protein [Spirochaetaceae bacterium]